MPKFIREPQKDGVKLDSNYEESKIEEEEEDLSELFGGSQDKSIQEASQKEEQKVQNLLVKKYFNDDSILIRSTSLRQRRKLHEELIEQKKMAATKDKTQTIYVEVPDKSNPEGVLMEEFVFELDDTGKNYEYSFGHSKLQIFDYRKY